MLAPIGMSVYMRLNHIRRTVEALKKNALASKSILHIFSDAPHEGDEAAVAEVRKYINKIDGFAEVNITERETNSRVYNNRMGMRSLLDNYGKLIWMEEDIVTSPGFLEYMNSALEYYTDEDRVISITGYTPPIRLPQDYVNDVFFLQRFNAWGFGSWKKKFDRIEEKIDPQEYRNKMRNREFHRKLVKNGPDIPRLIDRDVAGIIDALDLKIMYQQVLHDWYTVYPRQSLVQNIGHDGSGVHCRDLNIFHHDNLWAKVADFRFQKFSYPDERIVSENMKFRQLSSLGTVLEKFRHIRRCLA